MLVNKLSSKLSFFAGLTLILGFSTCEAAELLIHNYTIFDTNGSWPAKAVVKVDNKSYIVCPTKSTECPNEISIDFPSDKKIKVEVIRYIFGNVELNIDANCSQEIKPSDNFNLYGSPSDEIGYGSKIYCKTKS